MELIHKAIDMMEDLINGKANPVAFSVYFADYCFKNYEAFEHEKAGVGDFLDDEIPFICDEGEPGFDPTHMIAEIKRVCDKVKEMIGEDNTSKRKRVPLMVHCPLLNREIDNENDCYVITAVALDWLFDDCAPQELFEIEDWQDKCTHCEYNRIMNRRKK